MKTLRRISQGATKIESFTEAQKCVSKAFKQEQRNKTSIKCALCCAQSGGLGTEIHPNNNNNNNLNAFYKLYEKYIK